MRSFSSAQSIVYGLRQIISAGIPVTRVSVGSSVRQIATSSARTATEPFSSVSYALAHNPVDNPGLCWRASSRALLKPLGRDIPPEYTSLDGLLPLNEHKSRPLNFQDFSRKLQLKSLDGSIVENPHLLSAALMNHGPLMCILDFDQDHGSSGILHFINIFGIVQCNARPEVLVIENKAQYYQNSPTEFRLRIPHEVLYRNLLRFDDIWLSRDDFTTPTFDCEGNLISSKYKIPADGAIQIRKKVPPIWYIEGAAEVLVRKKLCVVGENANQLTKTLLPMPRYPTYPSTDP